MKTFKAFITEAAPLSLGNLANRYGALRKTAAQSMGVMAKPLKIEKIKKKKAGSYKSWSRIGEESEDKEETKIKKKTRDEIEIEPEKLLISNNR